MGQLDNQQDIQPAVSPKPHLHININLIESLSDRPAQTQAAAKTEQPQIEKIKTEQPATAAPEPVKAAPEPVKERPAYLYRNQNNETEPDKQDLPIPPIWKQPEAQAENKPPLAPSTEQPVSLRMDLTKFYEKQKTLEEAALPHGLIPDTVRAVQENWGPFVEAMKIERHDKPGLPGLAVAPGLGAVVHSVLRPDDRVPLFDPKIGKVFAVGALSGAIATGADLLFRTQTAPNSAARYTFTPSPPELFIVGMATSMPFPVKYRVLAGAAAWLWTKSMSHNDALEKGLE